MPLKGIPKCLSPDLLHALSSMGHGDEILLAGKKLGLEKKKSQFNFF